MKLLYLVTEDWFFWVHRLELARAARDEGFEVIVATANGEFREQIEAEGFGFRAILLSRKLANPWRNARAAAQLVRLYREERPDLVHHNSLLPILAGSFAARWTHRPPVVNAVTGLGHTFTPGGLKRRALRAGVERACKLSCRGVRTRVLFENGDDMRLFQERGLARPAQCVVIAGGGVDTGRFAPRERPFNEVPVVLLPARLLWSKGVGVLVEAGQILRARGVAHRIVLAGRPDPANPESIPQEQLEAWNREESADWIGYTRDMPGLLAQADVVCLPTWYREGIPLTLIEGAAAGKPLVTTDSPGCREVARHGENALLVPQRDPRALAGALEQLIQDPPLRQRMGTRSREWAVERFSKEQINARTFAVYRELLEGRWPS